MPRMSAISESSRREGATKSYRARARFASARSRHSAFALQNRHHSPQWKLPWPAWPFQLFRTVRCLPNGAGQPCHTVNADVEFAGLVDGHANFFNVINVIEGFQGTQGVELIWGLPTALTSIPLPNLRSQMFMTPSAITIQSAMPKPSLTNGRSSPAVQS